MSAVANIVLADAQATPVNHTFIPLGTDTKGVWWFEDQTGASSIGYNRISLLLSRAGNPAPGSNSGERMNRVKIGIHTPTLETLGTNDAGIIPPPTVSYVNRVNLEFVLPEQNSLQNRKDLRKFCQFLCADAQVIGMVENLQNVY
jgi:hypothetical protein